MHTTARLASFSLAPLLAVLAAPLAAQGFALRKATPGTLGQTLQLDFAGAPAGVTLLMMLSATAGPTPLAPLDPRSLDVGLDAVGLWTTWPTGSGNGTVSLPIPADASLHGAGLFFQSLTVPGTPLIGAISNHVFAQFGLAATAAPLGSRLTVARAFGSTFTNTSLSNSGGDVVYAAGGQGSLIGAIGLDSSDIYSFHTMTVRAGPRLSAARALGTATPLADGRVLFAGGVDANGIVLRSAELYDPATNSFTPTGQMAVARAVHAAALLNDGRVLVAGGTTDLTDAVAALANAQDTAEVWNPATGAWTNVAGIASRRLAPALTTLTDGRALLSGGFEVRVIFGLPLPVGSVATCQLFSPTGNSWSGTGAMRAARATHAGNTVRLADGRVLASGGASSGPDLTQAASIANSEVYVPASGTWQALPPLAVSRAAHSATLMPDGRVIVAGGAQGTLLAPLSIAAVERFDPVANTWQRLGDLTSTRTAHGAAVTPDGLLVVFGGAGGPNQTTLDTIETMRQ